MNRRYEAASHSPQPSAWYNLWLTRVDIYRQTGEFDKAQAAQADDAACDAAPELPGDRQQRELVDRLREYLLREHNLVHADNSRDVLVAALGTNKNTLTEAVKAVTGKTPMEYIRTMQLEQARHLLDKHPELTVESVAFDCGFNAPNTFYRLFCKHYGISPAEYRKIASSVGQ